MSDRHETPAAERRASMRAFLALARAVSAALTRALVVGGEGTALAGYVRPPRMAAPSWPGGERPAAAPARS